MSSFVLCFLCALWCSVSVLALPTWEGLNPRSDFMSSLVPTNTHIQVLGGHLKFQHHLTSHIPGEPGNLTALPMQPRGRGSPPLFSLAQNQLWQYKNESTIYPVLVRNSTHIPGVPPLQMVLGKQPAGTIVRGGTWQWRATMLRYELGTSGNSGVFYSCSLDDGTAGIFFFLSPSPTPANCNIVTLHSFVEARNGNAG
ncbi:hypothetical protein C8R46DRAFT_1211744 [Mycena filopes]|nr:hypothetical protein C8R46DRAFT_1211744 [Mycena filopes]